MRSWATRRHPPDAPRDHFSRIAPQWSHLGPPLRPSADDTAVVQRAVAGLGRAAHAVVLGLTPEIIACTWPANIELSAVDHSAAMIRACGRRRMARRIHTWCVLTGVLCRFRQPDRSRRWRRLLRPAELSRRLRGAYAGVRSRAAASGIICHPPCSCGRINPNRLRTSRVLWPAAKLAACIRSTAPGGGAARRQRHRKPTR